MPAIVRRIDAANGGFESGSIVTPAAIAANRANPSVNNAEKARPAR
jgi:hypothetical protein